MKSGSDKVSLSSDVIGNVEEAIVEQGKADCLTIKSAWSNSVIHRSLTVLEYLLAKHSLILGPKFCHSCHELPNIDPCASSWTHSMIHGWWLRIWIAVQPGNIHVWHCLAKMCATCAQMGVHCARRTSIFEVSECNSPIRGTDRAASLTPS